MLGKVQSADQADAALLVNAVNNSLTFTECTSN
jgi:hypothetical protein